jgi:hypothetical protein
MVKSLVLAGCVLPSTVTAPGTRYWSVVGGYGDQWASESQANRKIYEAGVLSHFHVKIHSNSVNDTVTLTLRKNSADTAITISIPAGQLGTFQDITNTVTVASGDDISVKSVCPGGSTGSYGMSYDCFVFTPTTTSNCVSFLDLENSTGRTGLTATSTRYFHSLNGYFDAANTTEAISQLKMQYAGTFSNMTANVVSNSRTTNTTLEIRKNGTAQTLTIVYGNVETGFKSTVTNPISVVDDDLINGSILNSTGTAAISYIYRTIEFRTTGDPAKSLYMMHQQSMSAISRNITIFFGITGYSDARSTESNTQFEVPVNGFTAKHLGIYVSANAIASSSTCKLRKNGADTALVATISSTGVGWFEDSSNSVSLAEGDLIDFAVTTGVGSGSQTMTIRSITMSLESSNASGTINMDVTDTMVLTNKFITKV